MLELERGLLSAEQEPQTDDDVHIDGTLYLNADNPLVHDLARNNFV